MSLISIPGRNKQAEAQAAAVAAPLSRLEQRREVLREKFAELQWDLGGAAYEMAARDYFRIDVLASLAARLQVVDAELAEIERMARLEKAGAAGSCSGCGSLYARGAVYCWRCGRSLAEGTRTVVGPTAAGQVVMPPPASVTPRAAQDDRPPQPTLPPESPRPAPAPAPPSPGPGEPGPEITDPAPEAVPEMRT